MIMKDDRSRVCAKYQFEAPSRENGSLSRLDSAQANFFPPFLHKKLAAEAAAEKAEA